MSLYVLHNNIGFAYDCENTLYKINSIFDIDRLPINEININAMNVMYVQFECFGI